MPAKVDLYDNAYANYDAEVYRQIRVETYGEDLGQTSWVTSEESEEIPRALHLTPSSYVLEIGCGSGRYALQVAATVGCRVVGLDANGPGIQTASQLATARDMASQARFEICDAAKKLPFDDATFDAAFANDVLCHIPGRLGVLREIFRVLKPGGRMLFSDALVIGGLISQEEIATRSSIGFYIFSPPGENERIIREAGLRLERASDTSEHAALIAKRWREAREKRREALLAIESAANFEGVQRFLSTVYTLTSERRLLRYLYLAEKPRESVASG
ncbi:MAG TPA: class I SAM-dependent methyltransferase [Candidatus Acidoferrum sp.]|jgi:SAM-dependent methyltransferase